MRLLAYKSLTLLIILLGRLRFHLSFPLGRYFRKDSPLESPLPFRYLSINGIWIECCDCGLVHRFFKGTLDEHFQGFLLEPIEKDEDALRAHPLRPDGYDYSWRLSPEGQEEEG